MRRMTNRTVRLTARMYSSTTHCCSVTLLSRIYTALSILHLPARILAIRCTHHLLLVFFLFLFTLFEFPLVVARALHVLYDAGEQYRVTVANNKA